MNLLAQSCCCSIIDWCKVSEIVFNATVTASLTALFTVGLGVAAGYTVDRLYRRRRFQKQEDVLVELAELREEGVRLRNKANHTTLEGYDYDNWNNEIEGWKKRLFKKADEFSPVEGERLRTLDFMPADVFPVFNPRQLHVLRYVSETLRRLEKLLEQRFRPKMAP